MLKKLSITTAVFVAAFCCTIAFAGEVIMLTPMEELGKLIFFDKISYPASMSCAECHAPSVGFTGPVPGFNLRGSVYPGAIPMRFGNRKPPSSTYATFSPIFHYDNDEGLFIGGNFWDGRATGERLGNPAADQALGPFLNPVEQNNPSKEAVIRIIAESKYAGLWEEVWGEPISYASSADIEKNYDRVGLAVAAYEASPQVSPFSSKFDIFWFNALDAGLEVGAINMGNWMDYAGMGLTNSETEGLALFNDEMKGKCALCHVLDPVSEGMPPVFTDFSFDNLGVPKNPDNPFYGMDEVFLDDGSPINPLGEAWIDPGLGGFLETRPEWADMAAENYGKHKVPTLRNVDKRPAPEFPKAYMHNGALKSLYEVVHFYNTRDVEDWPAPEVADNVNTEELGDLGLTYSEEMLIVVFMKTLSDGYDPKKDKLFENSGGLALEVTGPNPFNPSTTFRYDLPKSGIVRLYVYNVNGARVATLVDGWKEAGEHHMRLDGANMTSGVYFLHLNAASGIATKKIVLLR